jgi:hypothetical protein
MRSGHELAAAIRNPACRLTIELEEIDQRACAQNKQMEVLNNSSSLER